jgi:Flp pilus assembly protein TadB
MKFSIRDLLLVTVIAAILLAWWVDHRRQARESKELKEQLEQQAKKAMERATFY